MQNNYKYLIWVGTIFLIIVSIYFLAATEKVVNTAASTNTVSFSATGKVLAKPDVAVVNLTILTDSSTSKTAQDENNEKSNKLNEFLRNQGIEDKDIKTVGYNIYPQYTYPQYGKATISGYQVNNTTEIKIRDLSKVSQILDGAITAGANQVNQLTFKVDDPDKLKAEARERAVTDAKDKAKTLEKQVGIKLGKILNFVESSGDYYPIATYDYAYAKGGIGGGGSGPSVESGENEITVTVSLTYQIK